MLQLVKTDLVTHKIASADYGEIKRADGYFGRRSAGLEDAVRRALLKGTAGDLPACLEHMHWKRVVFDEFHEVLKTTSGVPFVSLRELSARHFWGLTGTPALTAAKCVADMASLLHVFVDPSSNEDAQRFLQCCVRSNTWNKQAVQVEEHIVEVVQTQQERVLYLSQQQHGDSEAGRRRLLQLCSHFSPDAPAKDADGAIESELEKKRAAVLKEEQKVAQVQQEVEELEERADALALLQRRVADRRAEQFAAHADLGLIRRLRTAKLPQLMLEYEQRNKATGLDPCASYQPTQAERLAGCAQCTACWRLEDGDVRERHCNRRMGHAEGGLRAAKAALTFLETTLKQVESFGKEGTNEEDAECCICMDTMDRSNVAITPCGHLYHHTCIVGALQQNAHCPTCRAGVLPAQCRLVETMLGAATAGSADQEQERRQWGSKLHAIVEQIRAIHRRGDEQAVVFIQWTSVLRAMHAALTRAKVRTLLLDGGIHARAKVLEEFIATPRSVLLLSLEDSPSGMNLTCANHCLLVHPMCTDDKSKARDWEKQAIGRIVRTGQTKPCHIYRFQTKDTIETELAELQKG